MNKKTSLRSPKEVKAESRLVTNDRNRIRRNVFRALSVVILAPIFIISIFNFEFNFFTIFIIAAIIIGGLILIDNILIKRVCERDGLELKKWKAGWSTWPYNYYKCSKGHIFKEMVPSAP